MIQSFPLVHFQTDNWNWSKKIPSNFNIDLNFNTDKYNRIATYKFRDERNGFPSWPYIWHTVDVTVEWIVSGMARKLECGNITMETLNANVKIEKGGYNQYGWSHFMKGVRTLKDGCSSVYVNQIFNIAFIPECDEYFLYIARIIIIIIIFRSKSVLSNLPQVCKKN